MKSAPALHRYQQIADSLREELPDLVTPDGRLPSERKLVSHYGVQRNTIRQALAVLESEGVVTTLGTRGTFQTSRLGIRGRGNILLVNPWNDTSTAISQVVEGLNRALQDTGHTVLRFDSRPPLGSQDYQLPTLSHLAEGNVAGIVIWPHTPADVETLVRLQEEYPIVTIDRRIPGFPCDSVRTDDVAGAYAAVNHLFLQGHRRIAFVATEVFSETIQHRFLGYLHAHRDMQVEVDYSLLLTTVALSEPSFTNSVMNLLKQEGDPITAICCSNDGVASVLLSRLRDAGIAIPEDIAITGYGDLLPDYTNAMQLTSVRQPFVQVGLEAGRFLLSQTVNPRTLNRRPKDVVLPVELIVRNSSQSSR